MPEYLLSSHILVFFAIITGLMFLKAPAPLQMHVQITAVLHFNFSLVSLQAKLHIWKYYNTSRINDDRFQRHVAQNSEIPSTKDKLTFS